MLNPYQSLKNGKVIGPSNIAVDKWGGKKGCHHCFRWTFLDFWFQTKYADMQHMQMFSVW